MPKLLFIWYKRSKGILEGGGQCSLRNHKILTSILGEDEVDSYYVHDEFKGKSLLTYAQGVWGFFSGNYFYGLSKKRVSQIVEIAMRYDYVFIDRSVFGIVAKALKDAHYKGRVITHFHNVETVYFDALLSSKLPGRNFVINTVDRNDRWACEFSDSIVTLNQRDEALLRSKYNFKSNAIQAPIAMEDRMAHEESTEKCTGSRPSCLFFGSYFAPNNQGILWFVENVLPHVDVRMRIVGKGMGRLKEESPLLRNVEVIGDAPDLLPYLQEADIVILPIFSGSGMKVKTCEALMYGKHILGTQEAFEGYDVDFSQVGGLCESAQDFINKINEFAQRPRPRFNHYSRQSYLNKYSYEVVKKQFESLLE